MQILGGLIIALGFFLVLGNIFHFFPTFPFAGYLTVVAGGMVSRMGKKSS